MSGLSGRRFLSFPAPPPRSYFFLLLFAKCPRASFVLAPLGLKETETTATQAMQGCAECLIEMKSPMEQKIPQIFKLLGKTTTSRSLTKIFKTGISKIAVPFDLVPDKSDRELRIFCRLRNVSVGREIYLTLSDEKSISSFENFFASRECFCGWRILLYFSSFRIVLSVASSSPNASTYFHIETLSNNTLKLLC